MRKIEIAKIAMMVAALTAATSASAQVSAANGNLGDWNIWTPENNPGGPLTPTSTSVGGPNNLGYTIIPDMYAGGQDGGAYTFFGTGSSTTHALNSSDFSQSIAIYILPSTEVGNLLIDETPASTVLQNDGYGDYSYSLWAAENGFSLVGNGSAVSISAENGGTIGTITTPGWYDFNLAFNTTGETLSVSDLINSTLVGSVSTSMDNSDLAGSGYLWMTEWDGTFTDPGTLNVADLAATPEGAAPVPEASTMLAGALMLLPLGVGAIRSLRKERAA